MQDYKVSPGNWATELKWSSAALVLGIIVVGIITKFTFGSVVFARDPFYHLHPIKAVIVLAVFFSALKNTYLLLNIALRKAPVFAFVFAFIAPVLSLFCIYLFHQRMVVIQAGEHEEIAQNQMLILGMLIATLAVIEIKLFLSIRDFLKGKYSSE